MTDDVVKRLPGRPRGSGKGITASRARATPEVQSETETLMQGYFTYLLERELNTPGFLKKIKM